MTRQEAAGHVAYLVFDVGRPTPDDVTSFAVPVLQVLQVTEPTTVAPVPLAPAAVVGVMNHHGRIVTVADPAPLLDLPPQGQVVAQVVILRHRGSGQGNLGLQVAGICGILPASQLTEVDVTTGPCVGWVAQVDQRLIHVVELQSLLERLSKEFGSLDRELGQGVGL